jgi:flagellar basal-body rod modification protein FlgD
VSEANVQNALQAANNSLQKTFTQHAPQANKLGKDEFMKLLMAQVTHQDPLNPMDSKGMMDQLTGMGSLEQLVNLNENIGKLHTTQEDMMRANTFAFLDKDVTIRGGGVPVSGGHASGLQYSIPRGAASVTIHILNAQGEPVRDLKLGQQGPGAHAVDWDGQDMTGQHVADGVYNYTVLAQDPDQQPIPVDMYVRGKVSGVRFDHGRPKLTVNGEDVDVHDVIEMSNRSERLFGEQEPSALREDLRAKPPATRRRP